jgi:hypothetical protein
MEATDLPDIALFYLRPSREKSAKLLFLLIGQVVDLLCFGLLKAFWRFSVRRKSNNSKSEVQIVTVMLRRLSLADVSTEQKSAMLL